MSSQLFYFIGTGGVGSCHLIEPVVRFLIHKKELKQQSDFAVVLYDGDVIEEKNLERQTFTSENIGASKVDATKERLQQIFSDVSISAINKYWTQESGFSEGSVVFLAVDNHKTRKEVLECAKKMDDILIISGSNELMSGSVLVYGREGGEELTRPYDELHKEIRNPQDRRPDEVGCSEEVASRPQIIFTNLMVSTLMTQVFFAWFEYGAPPDELYFNLNTWTLKNFGESSDVSDKQTEELP